MIRLLKKFLRNSYMALVFLFLYAPVAVLIVFSFNKSKSRAVWGGFTLDCTGSCCRTTRFSKRFGPPSRSPLCQRSSRPRSRWLPVWDSPDSVAAHGLRS